ncbi:MAG: thiamine ABC transporter substrate binding subunit [Hyphomicrobiaceae bacterium]
MLRFLLTAALLAWSCLPVRAGDTLTVLTYESFTADWGPGPAIERAFEAECGCDLKWVAVGDGVAILNRLKLEGDAPTADLALGLDNNLIAEARASGLFARHGQSLKGLKLPVAWTDDTFLPFDYAHFAVVYDREKLADPPRSLQALVDGGGAGKIVIEDPRTSTPGLGLLIWIKAVYGDKADEAWTKLRRRVLTVTPGWSEAYALFTKGEAPMVLSYTTSPAYHLIAEKSDRYAALDFPEGHPLQIEVAAKLAKAKSPALADKFLAFMLSPGFQDQIPTQNWMLPAATTSQPLPPEFEQLVTPAKTLDLAPGDVAANRRAWTDEWLKAMSR